MKNVDHRSEETRRRVLAVFRDEESARGCAEGILGEWADLEPAVETTPANLAASHRYVWCVTIARLRGQPTEAFAFAKGFLLGIGCEGMALR